MLKASSLIYAVFICFIISILTGSIVYLNSIHKELSLKNEIENDLIDHCQSCLNYVLTTSNFDNLDNNIPVEILNTNYNCFTKTKKWGLLNIIQTSAYFKKDTLSSLFFIGEQRSKSKTALYLTDLNEKLKISGKTIINGDVSLPKKGYEIANILGNQQINNPKIIGNITTSNTSLPDIELQKIENNNTVILKNLSDIETPFNSFKNKTIQIELSGNETLNNVNLKGNFILKSNGTVVISSNSNLEDIIIYANEVIIDKNFVGSLQIYAESNVEIGKNVTLQYPSSIIINNNISNDKEIFVDENSTIYGGIVINSEYQETKNSKITIEENNTIIGDIYCNGITELKGNLTGSIYTNKLEYNTEYSSYSNLLLNMKIDSDVPENFIHFPFFKNATINTFEVIKNIQ